MTRTFLEGKQRRKFEKVSHKNIKSGEELYFIIYTRKAMKARTASTVKDTMCWAAPSLSHLQPSWNNWSQLCSATVVVVPPVVVVTGPVVVLAVDPVVVVVTVAVVGGGSVLASAGGAVVGCMQQAAQ